VGVLPSLLRNHTHAQDQPNSFMVSLKHQSVSSAVSAVSQIEKK
jgi:hypothetical protein